MSLHANDFSYRKWGKLGEKLTARGFQVVTLKEELAANHHAIDKLAMLHKHSQEGWPSPDPTQKHESSIESRKSLFTKIDFPERFSIMKLGEEYVGYTSAKNQATATAVHSSYRGIGVATYLKAYDIKKCIDDGDKYFESATANPAMQRVNKKLGYKFNAICEVRLVKCLSMVS